MINNRPVGRQTLYQIASLHSRAAIDRLVVLMSSTNENVALGACKTLLGKTIPDLKREESTLDDLVRVEDTLVAIDRKEKIKEIVDTLMNLRTAA